MVSWPPNDTRVSLTVGLVSRHECMLFPLDVVLTKQSTIVGITSLFSNFLCSPTPQASMHETKMTKIWMHKIHAKTYLNVLISKSNEYIQSSEIVGYMVNMYFIDCSILFPDILLVLNYIKLILKNK